MRLDLGSLEKAGLVFAAVLVFFAGAAAFFKAPQFVIQGSFGSLAEKALAQQAFVQGLVGIFLALFGLCVAFAVLRFGGKGATAF